MDPRSNPRTPVAIWLALGVVYVVWGSTYLAIRVMVETVPPGLGAALRFLLAGTILATWVCARQGPDAFGPRPGCVAYAALVGVLLCGGGPGIVTFAERQVPSGLTALVLASVPLWTALLERVLRVRPGASIAPIAVGFAGVALIVGQGGQIALGHGPGIVLLLLSALSWSVGAVLSQRLPLPSDSLGSVAIQMLAGGSAIMVVAIASGEPARIDLSTLSASSWLAFSYLTIPGAVVAYTAFAWLLQNGPLATVNTYAYVNPVIAVILGWAILGEQITPLTALGGAAVVGSVVSTARQMGRRSS